MIIGDIETTEKVEYEDLLKNYYEKMEIIEEQDKEIEKLHSIIKEVREYIKEHQCCDGKINVMTKTEFERLLEILDKGSDEISK